MKKDDHMVASPQLKAPKKSWTQENIGKKGKPSHEPSYYYAINYWALSFPYYFIYYLKDRTLL